ncbi:hypothetical protein N7528_003111 [Penicillium herquei]|nr:hypothetical protein N7528_003111 [Penicillium herquei]
MPRGLVKDSDLLLEFLFWACIVLSFLFTLFRLNIAWYSNKVKRLGGRHAQPVFQDAPLREIFNVSIAIVKTVYYQDTFQFYRYWIDRHLQGCTFQSVEANMLGFYRVIFTQEPCHIEAVLSTNFKEYGKGPMFHEIWKPALGSGIFNSDGQAWSENRRMLRPMFSKRHLRDLSMLEERLDAAAKIIQPGHSIELLDLFSRLTLDTITESLFGHSMQSLEHPQDTIKDALHQICSVQMVLTVLGPFHWLYPRYKYNQSIRVLDEFIQTFVDRTLSQSAEGLQQGPSETSSTFLHSLASFTRDPRIIRDQVLSVLWAGQETSAVTLCWLFYELSIHPEIYHRLRSEIVQQFGTTRSPTYDELKKIPYLQYTINETLRIHPMLPVNMRQALVDTALPTDNNRESPITVLKGDRIIYSTHGLHLRQDLYPPAQEGFPDPKIFAPERWEKWSPDPWQYIPFHAGPRLCPGADYATTLMAYTVVRILQLYDHMEYDGDWRQQYTKGEVVGIPGRPVHVRFFCNQSSHSP